MQLGSRVSKKYSALNAWFIMEILAAFPATSPAHDLLQPLFDEQYVVMDGKAVLRDKKEVKADSLQNPNDPDATYRSRNDQKVQGYVTNSLRRITMPCSSRQIRCKVAADGN